MFVSDCNTVVFAQQIKAGSCVQEKCGGVDCWCCPRLKRIRHPHADPCYIAGEFLCEQACHSSRPRPPATSTP